MHWICRCIRANFNEIILLLNPDVLCLHETFLKKNGNTDFKGYSVYNTIHAMWERASEGSTILANSKLQHSKMNLNIELQVVAIRVTVHKVIIICSVYLPPISKYIPKSKSKLKLDKFISQLPFPYLLTRL